VILDNGTPLEGSAMDFPNPGEHTLVAQVRDDDGTVLIESEPVPAAAFGLRKAWVAAIRRRAEGL